MQTRKDLEVYPVDTQQNQSVNELLSECEKARQGGNEKYAHELSLRATKAAPENVNAWLLRISLSPSFEERMFCVNRLNELAPDHHDRHNLGYFTLKELLEKDPALEYLDETEELYRVVDGRNAVVSIRKKRASAEPFASNEAKDLKDAYRYLIAAILGLMFAGVGTLVFAPLTIWTILQAGSSIRSRREQVNSVVVLVLASIVFLVGIVFSILFVLHLIG